MTKKQAGKTPRNFITDGLPAYMKSSKKVFGKETHHVRHIHLYRERKVREQNTKLFTNMIMPMAKNQLKWNFEPHPTLGCMN